MSSDIAFSVRLTPDEAELVDRVADVLIPSYEDRPSASEAGVGERWIHAAIELRPDLVQSLRTVLAAVASSGHTADGLREVGSRDPETFGAVANMIAASYLMSPRARGAIGYQGQEERPLTDDIGEVIDLLANVVERGPIYRSIPSGEPA